MSFLKSLHIQGLLSFAPDAEEIPLTPLNVVIGPNGSGKSNLIEVIDLLKSLPTGLSEAIRDGGGIREWIWKGHDNWNAGSVEVKTVRKLQLPELQYSIDIGNANERPYVIAEKLGWNSDESEGNFYQHESGRAEIAVKDPASGPYSMRELEDVPRDESVFFYRKDPQIYRELTWFGSTLSRIQIFREWSFGRYFSLRQNQPADLPTDVLLPDARNLALVLNAIEQTDHYVELNRLVTLFLPRFRRFSTRVVGGTVQLYFHEEGLSAPIPATRLSDGTIRFVAMLAMLLNPKPPPLICLEEPELGLHPDAAVLLADALASASERTQLIVTTHSDALVSALTEHADSVLVCEYRNGTVFERLESEKLQSWLERYRLGELWRIGQLGGNP